MASEPEPDEHAAITEADMAATRAILGKTARAVAALGVVGVFVFWLGWVRAPSPEEVCAHKIGLVTATADSDQTEARDALIGQYEATCVIAARRKIQLRGKLVYAEFAKCVTAATSLSDAERC